MNFDDMTKEEKSLLLYFECRAVDHGGLVDTRHMNADDMAIAKYWNDVGFVRFGRLTMESIKSFSHLAAQITHWCELSDNAWSIAHAERRARYHRIHSKRKWKTTKEKRGA